MMTLLLTWLFASIGFLLAGAFVPGFKVQGFGNAAVAAALFGILNALFSGLLYFFLGVATLGLGFLLGFLTNWIVSAIVLKITDALTRRLTIVGFLPAIVGGIVISLATNAGRWLVSPH